MKRILCLLLIAASLGANAQAYNNEWIDYSKTYYKFKVGATKMYRISQSTLAGLGIENTPAEYFQLWRNGEQVPLYTSIQTGIFGSSDYIEFWGEMNDGKPDKILYKQPEYQMSEKWSLESDTAMFFLTINPDGGNLRLAPTANNVAGNILPPSPFCIYTNGTYPKTKINAGRAELVGDSYTYSSVYDWGEGWSSSDIVTNGVAGLNQSGLRVYTGVGAPAPWMNISVAGNSRNPRRFRVNLNGDSIYGQQMNYFEYAKVTIPLTIAQISGPNANMQVVNKSIIPNDRMVMSLLEMTYPRLFNFNGVNSSVTFELPANPNGDYLEISGFSHGNISPILYDLTNNKRYVVNIQNPSLIKVVLEPSAVQRRIVISSQGASYVSAVTNFTQKNFVNYSLPENQGDYLMVSHPTLSSAGDGSNPLEDYMNYRRSPAGGSFNARLYMIDDLTDQFGLGIRNHPLSVRNFVRWARANFTVAPRFVILLGKGVTYNQYRAYESNPDMNRLALVPTYGYPASDNMLTSEFGSSRPLTPIGRVSAITGTELAAYLAKVKEFEAEGSFSSPSFGDMAWKKNVVHVTGASAEEQQALLENALRGHANIIKDTFYGATVHEFSKNSASAVEQINSARLAQLFNEGIGILTYFGHSSSSTLEFNLDNPQNYENQGKYPLFVVMGCNAGNFFNFNIVRLYSTETLSERYVLEPQRGAIAFLASTHLGIVHYLDIYNTKLYKAISTSHYGKAIGEAMDEAISQIFNTYSENDFYARFQCEQFTLHGDPALKMHNVEKPDYVIEDQMVSVSPSFISTAETVFKVNANVYNLGKALSDSVIIEVKRTYPDLSTEVTHRDTVPGIRYVDSLTFPFDIVPMRDKGLNRITITIDPANAIDEVYETNNVIVKDVHIYDEEARPIYPYNYSIVNEQGIKLMASTANPFDIVRDYRMELDTTALFNSPFKVVRTLSSPGGVMEFTPGITFTDSTVYYWRVAPVVGSGELNWNNASFVYLPSSEPGFNQSHFYQHTKSESSRIYIDTASRVWKYQTVMRNIFIRLGTWVTSGATQETSLSVAVDGESGIHVTNWFSSLVYNVFHPVTLKPWQNQVKVPHNYPSSLGEGLYGSTSPKYNLMRPYNFEYRYTDVASRKKMMDFMEDTIPDGYYVVVRNFTLNPAQYPTYPIAYADDWKADESIYGTGVSLYHYLKDAGLAGIDSFYRPRPFALVYKKNDPSFTPRWVMGAGMYDNPTLSADVFATDTLGFIKSPAFGPAMAWKELKWRGEIAPDTEAGDLPRVDVIGVDQSGVETTLLSGLSLTQQDYDISNIDANAYPFLRLRMSNMDTVFFTPYQLKYWRLTYDPVPEGAIAPNLFFNFKDTVEVGEPVDFGIAFRNISKVDFDSLKVKLIITDRNNFPTSIPLTKLRPLTTSPDTIHVRAIINTEAFAGKNTLYVEVNPDFDQPEQFHFNNFAFRDLYVKPDSLNPLLDVTFDGVHILNRDIISSKPDIVVKLKDEARWMILDDTSLVTVQVRYPDGNLRRFSFNTDTLNFLPAGQAPNPDNTATIHFNPEFLHDGDYELIITGRDRSSNAAGRIEYRVEFQVINKPMISNMLNYPNPFTTSTAFVFTVTGSEVPQNLRIQIMTITGKIVRDITKEELGPIHIGRNITEFKWDGTDQYGQKLANGIYLYRVITNLNGKSLDKYKAEGDNTDQYFNKGYGKMYLMR